ncbi:MAG: autotransporter assembly complex protein TamA [Gammaproteobacteria bacterium]|nr:autotransporter assembly complex protein TamA [Gammaproteobacteria bacterium]
MFKSCRVALILLALVVSTPVRAQTAVSVDINGIDVTLEQNVRLYLSIEQQKGNPLMSDGRLRRLHKKANDEISQALQPYGFYRPTINSSLEKTGSGEWLASYDIDPGPALKIGTLNFSVSSPMAEDPAFQTLLAENPLRQGDNFSHLAYEDFKTDMANLSAERGYFLARFADHRIEIDLERYEARIYLDYEGGPRFRFGEVLLQQDVLNTDLVNRYVPFARGDFYSLGRVLDFQQGLNDSGYFQSVEISPGKASPDSDEIPIEVALTSRKRNRYQFGLGYGTDTGARTSFGWQRPRVNKRGHKFDSELRISQRGYSALANYRVPVLNPRTDQIVYSVGEINEEFEDSESTVRKVGVSLNHGRGAWRETLSLEYQQEDFIAADDSGSTTLLIPGASWSRTWGSDFINVFDGLRFDIGLRGANTALASDIDFYQVQGGLKFITSLTPRNRIIWRGGFGGTETREFDDLPTSLRFYSGGAHSVRGYAYQSLGPTDADGKVIGARYMMYGGVEFEHYFNDRWGLALFYDVGNAIDDLADSLESGAGFGWRWKSPVGPVRVDLANAVSTEDQEWRLHVNIGPDL